ncbi:hypothetical protein HMPREF1557_01043 [Streptococcus sobrinus W1703]|uniref:Uncharacterized protein n=1 Tax=Streptococcus sobrinus W1703 TaxID=1227275 RepID=U2KGQ9_9STRE|nr:hypothetical protein HMPREF1557_01043 [Streptococcus sobrinus W1703]
MYQEIVALGLTDLGWKNEGQIGWIVGDFIEVLTVIKTKRTKPEPLRFQLGIPAQYCPNIHAIIVQFFRDFVKPT